VLTSLAGLPTSITILYQPTNCIRIYSQQKSLVRFEVSGHVNLLTAPARLEEFKALKRNQLISAIHHAISSNVTDGKLSEIYVELLHWLQRTHLMESRLGALELDWYRIRIKHIGKVNQDSKLQATLTTISYAFLNDGLCLACIKSESSSKNDLSCSYTSHRSKTDQQCVTQPRCLG